MLGHSQIIIQPVPVSTTESMQLTYPDIALQVPSVLLPAPGIAPEQWAVIACDQHTSQPEYWHQVEEIVGDAPSTLKLIFPEVYLEEADRSDRIAAINGRMRAYLDEGLLVEQAPGFVIVDRQTKHADSRKGLLVCLDLEHYSFGTDAVSLIRPTEGTDPDRLPPRVEIRRDAMLELPHIIVLIDDPGHTVIEPFFDQTDRLPLLYDFDLMLEGGHLRGWHVAEPDAVQQVVASLSRLLGESNPDRASDTASPMLYLMGDGNHSFATAQRVWQEAKERAGSIPAEHPARHVLVELVNIHDVGLTFEPIHRVIFDADPDQLMDAFAAYCRKQGSDMQVRNFADRQQWEHALAERDDGCHHLPFVAGTRRGIATIHRPRQQLAVAALQNFLSDGKSQPYRVDYIHGSDAVDELGGRPGNLGFYTSALDKHSLFSTIRADGPLPRKSFSIGAAEEKRYYLESRRITL
jgi:hypothetical protein